MIVLIIYSDRILSNATQTTSGNHKLFQMLHKFTSCAYSHYLLKVIPHLLSRDENGMNLFKI